MITVSQSSKNDIVILGFTKANAIEIIHNGISAGFSPSFQKTEHPSFIYLGRLKAYKNIDVAIKAFAKVVNEYKDATFTIAGNGECFPKLTKLVKKLRL